MLKRVISLCCLAIAGTTAATADTNVIPAAPNGIEFPADYPDWRVISVSHRIDHKSMRVIVGNDVAVKAAREGNTNPWPEGSALGKVVWKEAPEADWQTAIAPDRFIHAEFMFKDSKKWSDNATGWGWARWVGNDHKPYGQDVNFSQECIACHTPVKGKDWVFTKPASFPSVMK
ncbi:MAG: cytochrome P460 family protein [Chromatiales bacterium]|jgi:hypothetical protein